MSTEPRPASVPAPRRRRRWLRRLLVALLLLIPLLLALPYAVALGPVRAYLERAASERAGASCRIGALDFSWRHGLTATGVELGNPAGFPGERPSLRVRELNLDRTSSPTLGVTVRVDGLEVFVEQRADGSTNLQRLGGAATPATTPVPGHEGTPPAKAASTSLAFDVAVQNGRVEVRREGVLLDVADRLAVTVKHAHGASRTDVEVDADLRAGPTHLEVAHEQADGSLRGALRTPGLQLAAWQPLLATFLPGQVTALAGTAVGDLTFERRADGSLTTAGTLAIDAPMLAGPLVGGLQLGGAKWTLTPAVAVRDGSGASGLDLRRAVIDLGWLQLRGRDASTAARVACDYDLDVAALAAFDPDGTWLPAVMRGSGARLTGQVELPAADLPTDAAALAKVLTATATFTLPRLLADGFEFAAVGVTADVRDGRCHLTTADATRLDGGPLSLVATFDLTRPDTVPTEASLRWQGGSLHGGSAQLLRYAMPLLTGLGAAKDALTGSCDLELRLSGPALRRDNEGWIAWLDEWRGDGKLGLRDAAFAPVPALQGLLAPLGPLNTAIAGLGDGGRLRLETFATPFSFASGIVRTTAGEWLSKGRRIGLSGNVGFDGALDYQLDLTALLRGHRDGDKVLELLSGALPPAALQGSLTAPKLALPALDAVLQRAAEAALKQKGGDLLKRAFEDLLKKR